jgi:ankyrin repeat protein
VADNASAADEFVRLACLAYDDVGPEQWAEARALLADQPDIVAGNIYAAAVAADPDAIDAILRADPAGATRAGGPKGWDPLLYLAYARHDPTISEHAVLGSAQRLLDAGADPNAGFVTDGLDIPFTVLTGVFGEGEMGPVSQPRHPHSLALGRLLLEAGADANDSQTLYNRMFRPDDDHLLLLLEFGLGSGDGGPWRARMADAFEPPVDLLRGQLAWAIAHGMTDRVRLLADHGVDLAGPMTEAIADGLAEWAAIDGDSPTPTAIAALTGYPEIVDLLIDRGAPTPVLSPGGALVAAVLAVDRVAVDRLRAERPDLVDHVRSTRPSLTAWAAAIGRTEAVELLVELGFDVNALGRTDTPSNQPWQTALHRAVEDDNLELAQALLRLGADPDVTDARFHSTPLGWAHHFDHPRMVDLLD